MAEGHEYRKAFLTGAVVLASGVVLERTVRLCTFGNLAQLAQLARRAVLGVRSAVQDPLPTEPQYEEVADPRAHGPLLAMNAPPAAPPIPTYEEPGMFTRTYDEMVNYHAMRDTLQAKGSVLDGKTFLEA